MLLREAKLGAPDPETRTVPLTISTEYPVDRGSFVEVLSHLPGDVDLSRAPLPLITGHDASELNVGVVEGLRLVGRALKGVARFGSSARAMEVFQDVVDRIVRSVSVGYQVLGKPVPDGSPERLRFRWRPLEVSAVAIPADPQAGFFRSERIIMDDNDIDTGLPGDEDHQPLLSRSARRRAASQANAAAVEAEREARAARLMERAETRRVNSISEFAGKFRNFEDVQDFALRSIADGTDFDKFREHVLDLATRASQAIPQISQFNTHLPGSDLPVSYGSGARTMPYSGKLRAFTGPTAQQDAYRAGMWLSATIGENEAAGRWCRDNGVGMQRAMGEGVWASGGALVPQELANAILTSAEQFSIFRKYAMFVPMNSASTGIPKAVGGLTPYFIGEHQQISESEQAWAQVLLNAKKLAVMIRLSNELMQDSVISVADYLATEAARAFGEREDNCGFVGNGTSTYGGMEGVVTKLEKAAYAGGRAVTQSGHDTFPEIDVVDMSKMMGLLPARAQRGAKLYCSPGFYGNVIERLILTAGGVTAQDLAARPILSFRGHEIVIIPGTILASDAAADYTNKVMCLYGDLTLSSVFGSRRDVSIAVLSETYAAYDQIGVQVIERFDIVSHDVGTATEAGAMVALYGNT